MEKPGASPQEFGAQDGERCKREISPIALNDVSLCRAFSAFYRQPSFPGALPQAFTSRAVGASSKTELARQP